MEEKIIILDFGSQYTQLIARRIRELNIYCEIYPYNNFPSIDNRYLGVILSGSPYSVHDKDSPDIDLNCFKSLPILALFKSTSHFCSSSLTVSRKQSVHLCSSFFFV